MCVEKWLLLKQLNLALYRYTSIHPSHTCTFEREHVVGDQSNSVEYLQGFVQESPFAGTRSNFLQISRTQEKSTAPSQRHRKNNSNEHITIIILKVFSVLQARNTCDFAWICWVSGQQLLVDTSWMIICKSISASVETVTLPQLMEGWGWWCCTLPLNFEGKCNTIPQGLQVWKEKHKKFVVSKPGRPDSGALRITHPNQVLKATIIVRGWHVLCCPRIIQE